MVRHTTKKRNNFKRHTHKRKGKKLAKYTSRLRKYSRRGNGSGKGGSILETLPPDELAAVHELLSAKDKKALVVASNYTTYKDNYDPIFLDEDQSWTYLHISKKARPTFLKETLGISCNIRNQLCILFKNRDFSSGVIPINGEELITYGLDAFSDCRSVTFYDCYFPTKKRFIEKEDKAFITKVKFLNIHHCRKIDDCHFASKLNEVTITQLSSLQKSAIDDLEGVKHLTLSFCAVYQYYDRRRRHGAEKLFELDDDDNRQYFNEEHYENDPINFDYTFDTVIHEYGNFEIITFSNKDYLDLTFTPFIFMANNIGFLNISCRFICDVSYNGGAEQKHRYKEPTDEGIFYRSYEYDYGFTRKLYDRCDNYEMCLKDAVEKKYDTKEFSKTKPQPTSIWRSSSPYTPENYDDWNRYYYTLHEAGKLNYYKDENGAFVCHHVKDCDTTDKNGMCTVS